MRSMMIAVLERSSATRYAVFCGRCLLMLADFDVASSMSGSGGRSVLWISSILRRGIRSRGTVPVYDIRYSIYIQRSSRVSYSYQMGDV